MKRQPAKTVMHKVVFVVKSHIHKSVNSLQVALSYSEMGDYSKSLMQIQHAVWELSEAAMILTSEIAGNQREAIKLAKKKVLKNRRI